MGKGGQAGQNGMAKQTAASYQNEAPSISNERTPLLQHVADDVVYHHPSNAPNETIQDDELSNQNGEVPGDFGASLSKTVSHSSANFGLTADSQYPSINQDTKAYSRSRRPSAASSQRHHGPGFGGEGDSIAEEHDVEEDSKSPFNGVSVARFWLIFGVIMANYFVSCFDGTIMASSHPVITSYFNASNSASWLSTAFLLTSTSFQPLFGRLSDTIGRKPPYIFTTFLFLVATIWCALAQSMLSFIMARALCGLGAGGMMAMGSIITSDLVPIEIRGAYQSYINIMFGAGSALGAATGGAIADSLGWRWEFGIQIPGIAICLLVAIFTTPNDLGLGAGVSKKSLWSALKVFDFAGSGLMIVSLTCLILGLNLGGNVYPWSHPIPIAALAIFAVGFPLFVFVESRVALPIMPLPIIRHYPRAGLIFANFVTAIISNAVLFNIPLYFQAVLLTSATESGLRLVAPTIVASICGVATGFLITWSTRLKWSVVLGPILQLLGTICLSAMGRGLPEWVYVLFLLPNNAGQGFAFPGTFISVLAVSAQAEQAVVTSTLILWRSLGMVLGVASSSLVMQNALLLYLEKFVTGPEKENVILKVRENVQAIGMLPEMYREQVIDSYAAALRATFVTTAVLSLVAVIIIAPVQLPRLVRKRK